MRFVTPKTEAQQTLSVLHRMRESLVRDRTKTANQMHGFLLEFGISLPKGLAVMKRLASVLAEHEFPMRLTVLLQRLHHHLVYLDEQIKALDKELACQLADDDLGSRLLSMTAMSQCSPISIGCPCVAGSNSITLGSNAAMLQCCNAAMLQCCNAASMAS